ncbi:MAG TPA: PilZ domain-containing protein [Rhizomicrobium sp.]|jgi:hypothetical protein
MKTSTETALEQRGRIRESVRLSGKIFFSDSKQSVDCIVTNLSAGGAGMWCANAPPTDTPVVLYVDGFGRFSATVTHSGNGEMGVQFRSAETERMRLEETLAAFVQSGMKTVTRMRRSARSDVALPLDHFTCADGTRAPCEVLDISLQGASLKTSRRPPIGTVVHLGRTRSWVVRHHDAGIGVQFLQNPAS